jgi:hypothetical protein
MKFALFKVNIWKIQSQMVAEKRRDEGGLHHCGLTDVAGARLMTPHLKAVNLFPRTGGTVICKAILPD